MKKTFEIVAGFVLIIIGLIGGLIPIFQGWMFGIPGLLLLAKHFKLFKKILHWAKSKVSNADP